MVENLLGRPTLSGVMRESPDYTNMGIGITNRVFIIGHADGLPLNDPYQVLSMKEAVRLLGQDPNVPLLRGLLEAYYSGCRDIWIVAAAPYSEYVETMSDRFTPNAAWGGQNFYERYYDRLQVALDLLRDFELPQVITAMHAPLNDVGVDFMTQLTNHCSDAYDATGSIRIGVIGSAVEKMSHDDVVGMARDTRWANLGPGGKFVMSAVGSAVFNVAEMTVSHVGPINVVTAAEISKLSLNRGMTNQRISLVITTNFRDLSRDELDMLANAKLNPIVRSTRSKRGRAFESVLLTDNTMAPDGSDFWSVAQVHLVQVILEKVRSLGRRSLGTVGFSSFRDAVNQYMLDLSMNNALRNYNLDITRVPNLDTQRFSESVNVDISVQPYFGLRTISFQAQVGPGA